MSPREAAATNGPVSAPYYEDDLVDAQDIDTDERPRGVQTAADAA